LVVAVEVVMVQLHHQVVLVEVRVAVLLVLLLHRVD
jgi:hypothetical protein